ncbi:MAG: hypothetical protein JRF33_15065 [Deltaproteobacteria bacterium]|nr:hypothetical protein [Deltaproteobacteria bacterium]
MLGTLSRGLLSNLALGGNWSKNYVILSDRRLYYSGMAIGGLGGKTLKARVNAIMPLEKIEAIWFTRTSPIFLLVFGILLLPVGLGLLFLIAYAVSRESYLVVSTGENNVWISFKMYGATDISIFAEKMGAAMTAHKVQYKLGGGD